MLGRCSTFIWMSPCPVFRLSRSKNRQRKMQKCKAPSSNECTAVVVLSFCCCSLVALALSCLASATGEKNSKINIFRRLWQRQAHPSAKTASACVLWLVRLPAASATPQQSQKKKPKNRTSSAILSYNNVFSGVGLCDFLWARRVQG